MSTCQSCDAEIVFVPSAKSGRPMILDATPTKGIVMVAPDGNELAEPWVRTAAGAIVTGVVVPADLRRARVVDVYVDHHVTCPDAKAWQGRRRGSES